MDFQTLHAWNVTPEEAVKIQSSLAQKVLLRPLIHSPHIVTGCDISYNRFENVAYAAMVSLDFHSMTVVEEVTASGDMTFPYIPGFLSFREIPVLLKAWAKLTNPPDVVLVDGQGIAHQRRLGIASHFGLWINRPTIGCGKSRLFGHFNEPAAEVFATTPLSDHGEVIGAAVRTKARANPLIISAGHMIDLKSALDLIRATTRGYRLPEPTRLAHLLANVERKKHGPLIAVQTGPSIARVDDAPKIGRESTKLPFD